jgi:hypothetical protein
MSAVLQDHPVGTHTPYARAFIDTVLRLDGVHGMPTGRQIERAVSTFHLYGSVVSAVRPCDFSKTGAWLRGRLPEPAAIEHAFMFVQFNTVLPPNAGQIKALNDWLVHEAAH